MQSACYWGWSWKHQNRGSEPGKRAIPYQCLPHEQIQTFVGHGEKGLVAPVPWRAFPILINALASMWEWALDAFSPSAEAQGTNIAKYIPTHCIVSQATAPSEITTAAACPLSGYFWDLLSSPSPRWRKRLNLSMGYHLISPGFWTSSRFF